MKFSGEKLLKLMRKRDESYHKASKRTGLSPAGLWNIVHGKSIPNIKTIEKIVEGYDITVDFFYK